MMNDPSHYPRALHRLPSNQLQDLPAPPAEPIPRRAFLKTSSLALGGVAGASWLGLKHGNAFEQIWNQMTQHGDVIQAAHPHASEPDAGQLIEPRPVYQPKPLPNLPQVKNYRSYLAQQELDYLSPEEIIRPHFKYRAGVCSGVPPRHLWKNMLPTAKVANEIRQRLGVRLGVSLHTVSSAYRSPAYNALCRGAAKNSQHMQNRALDLKYACAPRQAFDMACQVRREGFFRGGIGLYSSFIHIDTRGRNATWGA
ncbi:DUF882 domain-containing protein [Verrucomicrobiaceae bacterium R5-34]|nr:DUF882 domain-containing protein [Verrucomicrobiaceae bacterium R5-34]